MANKKHVFWQALFVTLLIFFLGLVMGVYIEQMRTDSINTQFYNSETSLYDAFALGKLADTANLSCGQLVSANTNFADKIYAQAINLEQFDSSNQLTQSIKIVHKKYDLLRTLLWMNLISLRKRCEFNTVIYLYTYDTQDIGTKSVQTVWERVLGELKQREGNNIILVPIAVDENVTSLDYLVKDYNVTHFPAVIINNKIIYDQEPADQLEKYLINATQQS